MNTLGFMNFTSWELIIILVIGLLLFGKRLPDVGRSLGKGIVEFKRGLKGVEEEIEDQSSKGGATTREKLPPYRAPGSPQGEDLRVSHTDGAPGIDPTVGKPATGN